jgi:hypothetical protein
LHMHNRGFAVAIDKRKQLLTCPYVFGSTKQVCRNVVVGLMQKCAEKWACICRLKAREVEHIPLAKHTPMTLEIGCHA